MKLDTAPPSRKTRHERVNMDTISILVPMGLAGQGRNQRGYAMAALLVAMSVTAILMTAVMPVWKQMAQREKEEELVFRGQQYVHAITLYGRKFANTQPPSVDVLVNQKFLRKKYKDPINNDDFQLVLATQGAPGAAGRGAAAPQASPRGWRSRRQRTGRCRQPRRPTPQAARGISPIGTPGAGPVGGIIGVTSKSKDKSIRLYNGRSHYNEWVFMYQPPQTAPGAGGVAPACPVFRASAAARRVQGPIRRADSAAAATPMGAAAAISDGRGQRGPGPPPGRFQRAAFRNPRPAVRLDDWFNSKSDFKVEKIDLKSEV